MPNQANVAILAAEDAGIAGKSRSLNVLGIPISAITSQSATQQIVEMALLDIKATIAIAAVHSVVDAQSNMAAKRAMADATLCVPDGVPLVWLLRLCGFRNVSRVFGPDLMIDVSREMATRNLSAFYLGGMPGVADELAGRLENSFPGLQRAGTYSPPFGEPRIQEKRKIVDMINGSDAHIVWIGLGSPKQECWMNEFRSLLNAPVLIGVGAGFDYNTGRLTRAPKWMQKCALEWVYRLVQEPRRLWRRYLGNNPLFLWYLFCQVTGLKSFD
jgi:N-acetylglucosaminyldiphosphoundecaprenol N-acetyl-beta-D-mannosaminyltransferase